MFPLRDTIPSRHLPIVNYLIIIMNSIIFLYELALGYQLNHFLFKYGLVPIHFISSWGNDEISIAGRFLPFFTSMFLHGGWLHIIGNMWFLYVFGDNVEDKLGHLKYALFYILCGLFAGFSQFLLSWDSAVPMIGASGAIAGVLGAYFILFPHSRVLTLVPFFVFIQIIELPAFIFLFFWFIMQFLYGTASLGAVSKGGVAWWAHIGGFIAGILLIKVFVKRKGNYA